MPLELTKQPYKYNLSGNAISIGIKNPDGIIKTQGQKGLSSITFGEKAKEGDSFYLTFGSNNLYFVFVNIPDDSTYQLPLASGYDFLGYIQVLYATFIRNYILSKYFNIQKDGNEITFTSKYTGSNYNLESTNVNGENIVSSSKILGFDTIYKEYYQILLQTFILINEEKILISEDLLSTDKTGSVEFDIAEYLAPYFKSEFSFPEKPGIDLLVKRPNSVVAFQFVIAEKYDGIVKSLTPIQEVYYAINGGVSTEDLKFYKENNTNYFDFSTNKTNFLTWQPNNKITSKEQPEKLFFFTAELLSFLISCKIYYTDGTDHTFNISDGSDVDPFSVYEIICGYSSLELEKYFPNKKIWKYEIIPTGATTEIISHYEEVVSTQSLNTGWDSANGMLPVGSRDPRWLVALGDASGFGSVKSMIPAYVSTPDRGWITSPFNNATWISLYADSYHSGSKDFFFMLPLTIENINPDDLVITMHFYADNSVHEIYVNGYPQSPNFPTMLPQTATDEYSYYGFNSLGVQVTIPLNKNWKTGGNNIIVWIKSGSPKVGLLVQGLSVSIQTESAEDEVVHTYDKIFQRRTYLIDQKIYKDQKYFIFKNSFNTWDSLRCTGENIKSIEIDRSTANVLNDLISSENKDVFVEYNETFETNTGWTDQLCEDPKAYINYLRDFIISKEIYEVKGDFLVPVRILSKEAELHSSREYVYNLKFKYAYTSKEQFFSDEIGIEDLFYIIDDFGNPITDDNKLPLVTKSVLF